MNSSDYDYDYDCDDYKSYYCESRGITDATTSILNNNTTYTSTTIALILVPNAVVVQLLPLVLPLLLLLLLLLPTPISRRVRMPMLVLPGAPLWVLVLFQGGRQGAKGVHRHDREPRGLVGNNRAEFYWNSTEIPLKFHWNSTEIPLKFHWKSTVGDSVKGVGSCAGELHSNFT